ncbi:MAG TPA: ATP synthase F0 subunit B [Candidatus Acidoferrales bacterium]
MSRRVILVITLTVLLVAACPVFAAEAAEGDTGPHSAIGMLFRWINLAVLFAGFWYLLRKAPAWFRRRAENIAASIEASGSTKAEADRRLREAEEKLARIEQETAEMRAQARRDAAVERERIQAAARDEAAKVERAAEGEIAAADRAARLELKAMAARLAVEEAETAIRSRITPQVDAALVQNFVRELAGGAR